MAYTRRGFKAGAKASTLNGGVAAGASSVVGSDLTTWSGITATGPGTGTINRGLPDEDIFTFTGVSTNTLTGVSGLDLDHASGATLEHTSSSVDFDEANAHIADTTLDHHTQYARTDGSRSFTAGITVARTTDGVSATVSRAAASLQAGSIVVSRDSATKPQSVSFQVGASVSMILGRAASSDDLEVGSYNGSAYAQLFKFATTGTFSAKDVALTAATVAGSASAGAATLPAAPDGFLQVSINGALKKLAYYPV